MRDELFARHLRTLFLVTLVVSPVGVAAQTTVPDTAAVLEEGFEGTLENWTIAPGSNLTTSAAAAFAGSKGLQVTIDGGESHLVDGGGRAVARAEEAYLTFDFDPNSVVLNDPGSGFIGSRSVQIAAIKGENYKNLVALRFYRTGGQYRGWIEWRDGADSAQWYYESQGQDQTFVLPDRWQQITIGFRLNEWVAAWVDGTSVRSVSSGVTHFEEFGSVVEVGKTIDSPLISPSGTLRFDDVRLEVPRLQDLWVDAASGSDSNDGLSPGAAFATIGRASDLAAAGTTVHIMPGVYRETIVPAQGGASGDPVLYKAENGSGTVRLRGSVRSSDLSWTQLVSDSIGLPAGVAPSEVWWTDLSSWQLDGPPRLVVRMNGSNDVAERLPLSREPDWAIGEEWKHSERWWTAEGGGWATPGSCDPTVVEDCDSPNRSTTQLTDAANDSQPGIEAGNLATLGDLTGAVLRAQDFYLAHYQYRRKIIAHNQAAGRITVDQPCLQSGNDPGLGWGTKYYVESLPALIDIPGEWWFDEQTDRLYLWPPSAGNPGFQSLEVTRFDEAFDLKDRSFIELHDLDMELYNDRVVAITNWINHRSVGVTIRGSSMQWANIGIAAEQQVEAGEHLDKRVESLLIEGNDIGQMDSWGILLSQRWDGSSSAASWTRSGLFDTTIRDNELHHLGFRPAEEAGQSTGSNAIRHADRLTFEENWVHDTATEGVLFTESVVQSPSSYGFSPSEIKIGEILVRANIIERSCQMKSDCAGIRVWGPDGKHVFRDFLVTGNVFRDTFGWSWPGQQRGFFPHGAINGGGGSGFYLDGTSGMHLYRNQIYNNANAGIYSIKTWRDGQLVLYNNVVANNTFGFRLLGLTSDTHVNVDTRIRNNTLVNNAAYGIVLTDLDLDYTNTVIDRNLYHGNGWRGSAFSAGDMHVVHSGSEEFHPTVAEIRSSTLFEDFGQNATPGFADYDVADHDPLDASWPDFRLAQGSSAVDAGSSALPTSLSSLLASFSITESLVGSQWDQGAFEGEVNTAAIFSDDFESGNTTAWN